MEGLLLWTTALVLSQCTKPLPLRREAQDSCSTFPFDANTERNAYEKVLVVSRIHGKASLQRAWDQLLLQFLLSVRMYATHAVICIGAESLQDLQSAEEYSAKWLANKQQEIHGLSVTFLPVFPWKGFTAPLNFAVQHATAFKFERILFQSLECTIPPAVAHCLLTYMDTNSNVLVCGLSLEGHVFDHIIHVNELRGRTCPWNTCAVWDTTKLHLTGFPEIGNGVWGDPKSGGVEEVSAIAMLLTLRPSWQAVLLDCSNLQRKVWDTSSFVEDRARTDWHDFKMASKDSRPAMQLAELEIEPSKTVRHVRVV